MEVFFFSSVKEELSEWWKTDIAQERDRQMWSREMKKKKKRKKKEGYIEDQTVLCKMSFT